MTQTNANDGELRSYSDPAHPKDELDRILSDFIAEHSKAFYDFKSTPQTAIHIRSKAKAAILSLLERRELEGADKETQSWWPTFQFDYEGETYKIPFKLGCDAGITIVDSNLFIGNGMGFCDFGPNALYGGYSKEEIIQAIKSGKLKPVATGKAKS
jgi:hypothetical protein